MTRELIDWRNGRKKRFMLATRRDNKPHGLYCAGCGVKVVEHEGPWIYGIELSDDTLCEACGQLYAPEVMREIRKYYQYIKDMDKG